MGYTGEKRKEYVKKNHDRIARVSHANYIKNKDKLNSLSKKHAQKNNYSHDKQGERKWKALMRKYTRIKYPLKGEVCEFCPNKATHHHHYTNPINPEKFWFVCKNSHDKIHHPEIYGEIPKEKFDKLKGKFPRKIIDSVSREQLLEILKTAKHPHHKLTYALGWGCGYRTAEVLRLKREEMICMYPTIPEELLELIPFRMKVRSLQKAFKKDCRNAGLIKVNPKVSFDSLRYGIVTRTAEQGLDEELITLCRGNMSKVVRK